MGVFYPKNIKRAECPYCYDGLLAYDSRLDKTYCLSCRLVVNIPTSFS